MREVAEELNYRITTEIEDTNYDLYWSDSAVSSDKLAKMKPYQKINHWPGMYTLSRKNNLGKHLMDMRKKFAEYRYFPETYILPVDSSLLLS